MGLENLKSIFSNIKKDTTQIGGKHGGLTDTFPSLPNHPSEHSKLDIDIPQARDYFDNINAIGFTRNFIIFTLFIFILYKYF